MIPSQIVSMARKLRPELESYLVEPQGGGVLLSELLLFLSCCEVMGVRHIVESGRKYGYSTSIFCEWASRRDAKVASVEWTPIRSVDEAIRDKYGWHISLLCGDGHKLISKLVTEKSALLMDGPKGYEAVEMIAELKPLFGAVHDIPKFSSGDTPSVYRRDIEELFPNALWSDDDAWLEEFAEMDRPYWSYGNNYRSREEMTRNAFTLCILPGVPL